MRMSQGGTHQGLQKKQPVGKWLYDNLLQDFRDRQTPWTDKIDRLRKLRLGQHRRNRMYPNAPNSVEPIIDDNVRSVTSAENQIIWSTRQLVNMVPMDPESTKLKNDAEIAFNGMLMYILRLRSKINMVLDQKNDDGFSVAKLVTNDTDYMRVMGQDRVLPDFEPVDNFDLIVPIATKNIRSAERIAHIMKYNERELINEGERLGWKEDAVKRVLMTCKQREDRAEGREEDGVERKVSTILSDSSEDRYVIWECYYHDDDSNKRVCTFCPDANDTVLKDIAWTWGAVEPGETIEVPATGQNGEGLIDMQTGEVVMAELEIPVIERPWPFVQFRFEDRKLDFYDSRGIAEMLRDNQSQATQFMRLRGMQYDYYGLPVLEGARGGLETFRWKPGEMLPPGVKPAVMPQVDPSLSYNADIERSLAARRVGSQSGSLSSIDSNRERKTATEVKQESFTSTLLGRDAIMRFSEPLGELFQDMWEFLRNNPVALPKLTYRNQQMVNDGMASEDIFSGTFSVQPAANSRAMNPDMQLQQMQALAPFIQTGIQAGVVKIDQFLKYTIDLVNPQITDQVVAEVNGNAPIEQLIQQIMQQVQQNTQYIQAMAQEDQYEAQLAEIRKALDEETQRQGGEQTGVDRG